MNENILALTKIFKVLMVISGRRFLEENDHLELNKSELAYGFGKFEDIDLIMQKLEKAGAIRIITFQNNRYEFEIIPTKYDRYVEQNKKLRGDQGIKVETGLPQFNAQSRMISHWNKSCEIPIGSLEYYVCESLFEVPLGHKIKADKILTKWGGLETRRSVYDAHLKLNKRVRASLEIDKLCECKLDYVWIDAKKFLDI